MLQDSSAKQVMELHNSLVYKEKLTSSVLPWENLWVEHQEVLSLPMDKLLTCLEIKQELISFPTPLLLPW